MLKTVTFDPTKWQLVPVDPTVGMVYAGDKEIRMANKCGLNPTPTDFYNAMCEAAPECPESESVKAKLLDAAKQVVTRWHSQDWKLPHTAEYILALDEAIKEVEGEK